MTLHNLQIKIKDFKSIVTTEWIPLDGKIEVLGKNLVDGGSNGSGKSTILEALYVSVSLCEISESEKTDERLKKLKQYYRDNKYPFEVFVRFTVDKDPFEIKATPEGIKHGSTLAKEHLYKLITSFLMQGMGNSLVKQEANECKAIISSYFNCDEMISHINRNVNIITEKLNIKIDTLKKNKIEFENMIKDMEHSNNISNRDLDRLIVEINDIRKKIGESTVYDIQEHNEALNCVRKLELELHKVNISLNDLYKRKISLSSNSVENDILQLKKDKEAKIKEAKSLYEKNVGNKLRNVVNKLKEDYNKEQDKKYNIAKKLATDEKNEKISESHRQLEQLKIDLENTYITGEHITSINDVISDYTHFLSDNVNFKMLKEETDNFCKKLSKVINSHYAEREESLKKQLNTKQRGIKKPENIKVTVYEYTPANIQKKKTTLYIIYKVDVENNIREIIENTAIMLDADKINTILQEIGDYKSPDNQYFDEKIVELENTDIAQETELVNRLIQENDELKLNIEKKLKEYRSKVDNLNERKFKYELYTSNRERIIAVENEIGSLNTSIQDGKERLYKIKQELYSVEMQIERWTNFLNEVKLNKNRVNNGFKDHVIDLYNKRLEPLINFYSEKVYNFNSKLIVKIGNKAKQPMLNNIKFDFTSGGEKSKTLFIFSLAHRDYMSKQRGFNNNYIFCDEVFDGMDEKSRQQSINFLTKGLMMENILIISHMEDASLPDFKKINVEKNVDGTIIKL